MATTGPSALLLATTLVCIGVFDLVGTTSPQSDCVPEKTTKQLRCEENSRIFPVRVVALTSRPASSTCPSDQMPCPPWVPPRCCGTRGDGCVQDVDDVRFARLTSADRCWNKTPCNVSHASDDKYIALEYLCLPEQNVHSFTVTSFSESSAMALFYDGHDPQSANIRLSYCLVEAPNNTSALVDVLLVKTSDQETEDCCTSLRVNGNPWLTCPGTSRYQTYSNQTTPLNVSLKIGPANVVSEAWAVVYARNGEMLKISCSSKNQDTKPGSAETLSVSTAAMIVGGVVAALVVGNLLVLLPLCRRLRRLARIANKSAAERAGSPADDTPKHPHSTPPSLPPPKPTGVRLGASEMPGFRRDVDCTALGAKPSSPTSRDVTCGHIGKGDVAGSDHEHVDGWQTSTSSGGDISNAYSIAGPIVTSSSDDVSNPYESIEFGDTR